MEEVMITKTRVLSFEKGKVGLLLGAVCALLFFVASSALAQQPTAKPRNLPTQFKQWKGDFDGMLERRMIRVLVPYSRTLYFNDKGRERGVTVDIFRLFERYINQKYQKQLGKRPITVFIIPTTRDKLLEGIADGRGDIAAGNLTVTEERREIVDFYVAPNQVGMSELVLTGPKSPVIKTADDLAGKTVHVRKASSYYESLEALNERFKKEGKPGAKVVLVPDALEDEDMMEMLNVGLLETIVVDDWKAKMWVQVLPKIKINEGAVVRLGGVTGWGIRKDSPKIKEVLGEYFTNFVAKQGHSKDRSWNYTKRVKELKDATGSEDYERFESLLGLFKTYGEKYGFDPLMLAAQGYQESQLNQNAKSHVGAIGIMQVMPATGKELKVGDITIAETNVHAGTKYMDLLMAKYLGSATFDETNRTLFAFACYNAGPGNIARMRKEAEKRGLDSNKWFNNVELVTAEKIGIETTTYVRNIFKYYVSYRLQLESQETARKAREQVAPGGSK
jgi:membrane-bound lytic murein transglycosylase MltF